jgi:cytochrome P450
MSHTAPDVNFFDRETIDCPYHAYRALRDEAPVWVDPVTGWFVLTRYEDIRAALLDTGRFTNRVGNGAGNTEQALTDLDPEKARELLEAAAIEEKIGKLFQEKGWVPAATLDGRDEPEHMQMRRLFDKAFRPARIKEMDPYVESLAQRLVDAMIDAGQCEFVSEFAVPLPLYVTGTQVGVPEEDMLRIKRWTDAWIKRMGLMQSPDERYRSAELEVEAQNYFQPMFERLRREPNDTLLSDLVNTSIPEWGRTLSDNELHAEMMADLFVGGSETTTNALAAGIVLLIEQPDVWAKLKSDPGRYLETFVEEVLRLESPVQGLLRETGEEIELHGVTIPAGSIVVLRYGGGNRDERRFEKAEAIDLERKQPRTHLAFGVGTHHCLGAPLARRELYFGFKAVSERFDEMWFIEGANDFKIVPQYFLRALEELHIGFRPSVTVPATA